MRAMKDSGIEWIGQIPEGWNARRLRFLCSIQTGNMDTQDNNPDGSYPFYVRSPNIERSNSYTFDNEAILMAGDGVGAGKVFHYVNGKYACHQRVYCLSDIQDTVPKYLFYYLRENFWKEIEQSNAKSTVDSIRLPMLKDFPVTFPAISEQTAIANYLDTQCSRIDNIISKEEQVIEKLKEYKQSVITEAVTKGLNPDVPMKDSGIEWIGLIPEGWGLSKIKHVTRFSPPVDFNVDQDTEIGYLPMECLKNGNMTPYAKGLGQLTQSLTPFQNGDLVVAKVTPCFENGNIAIADGLASGVGLGTSEIFVFRCSGINTAYLFYVFRNDSFKALCVSSMTGTGGLKRIPSEFIRNIDIPLPKENEQTAIANYLDKKCAEIDHMIEKKQQLIEKLGEYKKSLIYEMVTGKREVPLC